MSSFGLKDSGQRLEFPGGMQRDVEDGKLDYTLVFDGPMLDRYAAHLGKGAVKYGDRNWMLACSEAQLARFRRSAARHFRQWLRGDRDEDHASAVTFNLFAAEYVQAILAEDVVVIEMLRDVQKQYGVELHPLPDWA